MGKAVEQAVFFARLEPLLEWHGECDRIYFGHEFCQRLLPTPESLLKAAERAAALKKHFTFVTPFVTDAGLRRVSELLAALAGAGLPEPPEITVNDWGVLRLLHRQYPQWPAALGRLLSRQKKGPRIMNIKDRMPASALDHLMRANVDVPHISEFLRGMSVRRVELDNLLQGLRRAEGALPASLYYPYAYISTTRLCLLMAGDRPDKNFRSIGCCSQECLRYDVTLVHQQMPAPLLLKGNTYFFRNDSLPSNLEELGIDRLVFQPELPF